jgi:hypothetical protein
MSIKNDLPITKDLQVLNYKADGVYVFAVDGSNSMLLQAAPVGQWSRAEAAVQLISRQIFNLCRAEEKKRTQFIIIGYNAQRAIVIPLTPKQILGLYPASNTLSAYLLAELDKLGGAQHTNKGLCQIKQLYDDWVIRGKVSQNLEPELFSGATKKDPILLDRQIKLFIYTDAEDTIDRNLRNHFANLKSDPLVGIFIGNDKSQPGWIALRQILSKCKTHGKKQLFALDGFSSFSKLESIPFLSFDKNRNVGLCPSCLEIREKKAFAHKENLDLVVSGPIKTSILKKSDQQTKNRISAEIFVTAGPRKDDDVALGEDAGGVIVEQNLAWFWVADGTSESTVVMDYSSRSLAMQLGSHFVDELTRIPVRNLMNRIECDSTLIPNLLQKAFNSLLDSWTISLTSILESDDGKKIIDKAFELNPETRKVTSRAHQEFIDFTTTFLCGVVTNHGTGVAACIGDCPLCAGGADGLNVYPLNNDGILVRLRKVCGGYKFDRNSISADITLQRYTDANIVMAGSDGVGKLPEFLAAQMKSFSWPEIRKRIHRFIPKSDDDKTFCVIKIG